jgi:L-alanine-DL-glutamate epimerase-like enolase superfamily enzyme
MEARVTKHTFDFKQPSGTSRGVLVQKHSWIIEVWNESTPTIIGTGECSIIPGLSPDFTTFEEYQAKMEEVSHNVIRYSNSLELLRNWPSILFGLETALLDLQNGGKNIIFENDFTTGKRKININGLIWMGDEVFIRDQIDRKIEEGFSCLKMKIGAIDFITELKILASIRSRFSADKMTLRVDANGAFSALNALSKIDQLAEFDLHSIEQPIAVGQWNEMKDLCARSKVSIALDEELIGIIEIERKRELLSYIQPPFIILKPSLHGGLLGCSQWIEQANLHNIPWWLTSALESNIGLNAIAQFAGEFANDLPQGLGTGGLYTNNTPSFLTAEQGKIGMTL